MRLITGRGLLALALLLAGPVIAPSARADSADYGRCAPDGVALGGFDVVSYFEAGGPVPGSSEFTSTQGGLTYQFQSAATLARFEADPAAFLPTYRGWCAATLAMGRLACPDFTNFKIEDGALLLFEIAGFTNGREVWNSDPVAHRTRADANAKRLLGR